CAKFLQRQVEDLLRLPAALSPAAQETLLSEVDGAFTASDNMNLLADISEENVKASLASSNIHGSPGCDGIPGSVYKALWETLGPSLTHVLAEIYEGAEPTKTMRTSLMLFAPKPNKAKSFKAKDKRKISLLNTDFKTLTGIITSRLSKTTTHTLSPNQFASGDDRRISHAICLARDAIQAMLGNRRHGAGICDNDFRAAFDLLCLNWTWKVLERKEAAPAFVDKMKNIYNKGITVPVVNNSLGPEVPNNRASLRQGDRPSGLWYCFAIDPLIVYLERRLKGITIFKSPVQGPPKEGDPPTLPALETKYTIVGYLDDLKASLVDMQEFSLMDNAIKLFEDASGCSLHRDPASKKCQLLPLGRWRNWSQADCPLDYLSVTSHLSYLGVKLFATSTETRKANGVDLIEQVRTKINSFKSGRFSPFITRAWSLNSYVGSKLIYRTSIIDLNKSDLAKISTLMKSWLYQDCLLKPSDLLNWRHVENGGLGVHHPPSRGQALLTATFLQMALGLIGKKNHYLNALFNSYVLDYPLPRGLTKPPPFYSRRFFDTIKLAMGDSNIALMGASDWYNFILARSVTHMPSPHTPGPLGILIATTEEATRTNVDWNMFHSQVRQHGLCPDIKSFMWKLAANILPVGERLFRLKKRLSPNCPNCGSIDDRPHLLSCPLGSNIARGLQASLQDLFLRYTPLRHPVTPTDTLFLQFDSLGPAALAASWLTGTSLHMIHSAVIMQKATNQFRMQSMIAEAVFSFQKANLTNTAMFVNEFTKHFN
nr:reverse transcriptase domain-containing protein [Porticoccaceae bacterium]